MSWIKIDDNFYDHPKTMAAGLAANGLLIRMLGYSARHLTDGVVPAVFVIAQDKTGRAIRALICANAVTAGADGSYTIHDYLDYNPSKVEVLAGRKKRSDSALRNSKSGNSARWGAANAS